MPQWYSHPETVARLEALWKAFEHPRQDPTLGPAIWWRDYTDPTMTALTATDGPFTECTSTNTKLRRHCQSSGQAGSPEELADVVYIVYGTALTYGIDLVAVIA